MSVFGQRWSDGRAGGVTLTVGERQRARKGEVCGEAVIEAFLRNAMLPARVHSQKRCIRGHSFWCRFMSMFSSTCVLLEFRRID